jgi:hypothetical protein
MPKPFLIVTNNRGMPLLERTAAQDAGIRRRHILLTHVAFMCAHVGMLEHSHLFLLSAARLRRKQQFLAVQTMAMGILTAHYLIAEFYLVDRGLRHRLPRFSNLDRLVILP